ncbi:MAG: hypothetical protein DRP62_08765 [Planctomycetota bacterium]|nr:MAG: hypothetical protein DRP62_08765 [Planctomycetota bacterium]
MPGTITISTAKPINSVRITKPEAIMPNDYGPDSQTNDRQTRDEKRERKNEISQICQTLGCLVGKLNELYDKVLAENKEEIAKLSVEIARKILVQKVKKGDYEIESIVKEALKNAPTHQDLVVHLNPTDFVQCQKLQQGDAADELAGIKFVSDTNIARAECLLETGKGIIKSLIDEHLEQIGKALEKVE